MICNLKWQILTRYIKSCQYGLTHLIKKIDIDIRFGSSLKGDNFYYSCFILTMTNNELFQEIG